jgi:TolB protein
VTSTGGHAHDPSWSPDGTRLAYWRDDAQQVHVVAPDGSGDAALGAPGTGDRQPAWSPDGARVAVASARGGGLDVWAMGADTLAPVDLTPAPGHDTEPSWSPDGRIAFTSDRDGNPEIYVMNGDGSGQTRLTSDPAADTSPAWQPHGGNPAPGSGTGTPPAAGAPGAPSGSGPSGAPAAGGGTTVAGSPTSAGRPRPGSRAPATVHRGTLRIRIDLRFTPVRVLADRVQIAIPVRVNRAAVVSIEVRHHGRRVVLIGRRLRRGTTVLRWSRKIRAQAPWRGTYRIGLNAARATWTDG